MFQNAEWNGNRTGLITMLALASHDKHKPFTISIGIKHKAG